MLWAWLDSVEAHRCTPRLFLRKTGPPSPSISSTCRMLLALTGTKHFQDCFQPIFCFFKSKQLKMYKCINIYLGWLPQVLVHPSSSHWAQLGGRWVVQREVDVFPAPSLSPAADPSPSRGRSACSPAKPNSSCHHRAWAVTGVPRGFLFTRWLTLTLAW